MRRQIISIIVLLVLVFSFTPIANAAVSAGAKCSSVGSQATSNGKLFTCIMSGKKIIWNKGVSVSALVSVPKANYPSITSDMHTIDASGFAWTVGKSAIGFSCWNGITNKDNVVLQVKKYGVWLNKQVGYFVANSPQCEAAYPHGIFFNWVVDEMGETPTLTRTKDLMARVAVVRNDGSIQTSGSPFVREVWNSTADQMADFSDILNGLIGGGGSSGSTSSLPSGSGSKFANCSYKGKKLYGSVYITPYSSFADFSVYVTPYQSFSDISVYKTSYQSFATSCGVWYITPYSSFADFSIYITQYSSFADLSIYYTDNQSFAGLRK